VLVNPRNRNIENLSLGEIPRRVQADRHPQAPRQHVRAAEKHTGLDSDQQRRGPGCAGVEDVAQAEQRGTQYQSKPAAAELLEPAKQDTAEQGLLDHRRDDPDQHQRIEHAVRAAPADDVVHPG